MIGCIAKAQSYEVLLNTAEMEDVQWYDRAELAAAVRAYDGGLSLQEVQKRSWSQLGFFVPPPFAIAHHLMRAWALQDQPWFSDPNGAAHGSAASGGELGGYGSGAGGSAAAARSD